MGELTLITEAHADPPWLDTAISHAMLESVAAGDHPDVFRLHVPGRIVAFGRRDTAEPGYRKAVEAARRLGFAPIERLAGGRAAVFHQHTLAFSWQTATPEPNAGIRTRFTWISDVMADAFRMLGVEARVGEVPGEYCPGEFSVNASGRLKIMGVGQRLIRGAAHVGGVIVVADSDSIRDVLVPVYAALGIDWNPETAGSLADVSPTIDSAAVVDAVVARMSRDTDIRQGRIPPAVLGRAAAYRSAHEPSLADTL